MRRLSLFKRSMNFATTKLTVIDSVAEFDVD